MNSFVARHIARDCAKHQPDAFIVYMGNNEVVGPYGPPALPESLYASRGFVNACIAVKKDIRLGQLMRRTLQAGLAYKKPTQKWLGMEAFLAHEMPYNSAKLDHCYNHFRENIIDIIRTAQRSGARTILCTVPTNIQSCAPFGSMHKTGLARDRIASWDQHFKRGHELEKAGDYEAALNAYNKSYEIDKAHAGLAFCMARCLAALDRPQDAKALFIQARDLDTLRFRADSRINEVLKHVAADRNKQGVLLLDLENTLEKHTDDVLLGSNFLLDHVHLNFSGHFLAAYSAMQILRAHMPEAKIRPPERSVQELREYYRGRLLYSPQEAYRQALTMYRRKTRPPFARQIDHRAELQALRQDLYQLRRALVGGGEVESHYRQALEETPGDTYMLRRYGDFLLKRGQVGQAVRLFRKELTAQPFDRSLRIGLAQALARGAGTEV
jgi:tetratricopeptide (TPR) repeat protein